MNISGEDHDGGDVRLRLGRLLVKEIRCTLEGKYAPFSSKGALSKNRSVFGIWRKHKESVITKEK